MQNTRPRSRSRSRSRSPWKKHEEPEGPRYKVEETKTLKVDNYGSSLPEIESVMTEVSIAAGTSLPDEIELREGSAYIKYPSVLVSSCIVNHLNEQITIGGQKHRIQFDPYRRVDLTLAYDWYCEKCDYKNFARRNRCYRCETEKSQNCKLNYSAASGSTNSKYNREENVQNCSLMVRGAVISETQEEVLLDIFDSFSAVKDIRMIKNKMTGKFKDFAFIQFFTPEETAYALKSTTSQDFRINGEKVSVMYSRNKSEEEYLKPLPYEHRERRKDKKDKKEEVVESYYKRQRKMEIEQEKQRPIITLEQLKEKHENQLKKTVPIIREQNQQQSKRKQAEQLAKHWEKEIRMQNSILHLCPLCKRKFNSEDQMNLHAQLSERHKYLVEKLEAGTLG